MLECAAMIAVVIPCHRVRKHVLAVLAAIGPEVRARLRGGRRLPRAHRRARRVRVPRPARPGDPQRAQPGRRRRHPRGPARGARGRRRGGGEARRRRPDGPGADPAARAADPRRRGRLRQGQPLLRARGPRGDAARPPARQRAALLRDASSRRATGTSSTRPTASRRSTARSPRRLPLDEARDGLLLRVRPAVPPRHAARRGVRRPDAGGLRGRAAATCAPGA